MFDSIFWIQLVTSFLGTAGFAILFRIRLRHLPAAILGGGLTYAIYYVVAQLSLSVFAAALIASACSAVYSETLARVKRAPAIVFLLPCAIPIVPGGSLYRAMVRLISQDFAGAWQYLLETLKVGIGIAGGMVAVALIVQLITAVIAQHKKGKENKATQKVR